MVWASMSLGVEGEEEGGGEGERVRRARREGTDWGSAYFILFRHGMVQMTDIVSSCLQGKLYHLRPTRGSLTYRIRSYIIFSTLSTVQPTVSILHNSPDSRGINQRRGALSVIDPVIIPLSVSK